MCSMPLLPPRFLTVTEMERLGQKFLHRSTNKITLSWWHWMDLSFFITNVFSEEIWHRSLHRDVLLTLYNEIGLFSQSELVFHSKVHWHHTSHRVNGFMFSGETPCNGVSIGQKDMFWQKLYPSFIADSILWNLPLLSKPLVCKDLTGWITSNIIKMKLLWIKFFY